MFDFLGMMGNYDSRKVDRYKNDKSELTISTASVTDSEYPYETAVSHPKYNGGSWIIVQSYESLNEAKKGHKDWVKKMTAKKLPTELKDVMTSNIASLLKSVDGKNLNFKKSKKK